MKVEERQKRPEYTYTHHLGGRGWRVRVQRHPGLHCKFDVSLGYMRPWLRQTQNNKSFKEENTKERVRTTKKHKDNSKERMKQRSKTA